MHPARQQRSKIGRARKVRVSVEADVKPVVRDRRVNGIEYLNCSASVLRVVHVAVREVQSDTCALRDVQAVPIALHYRAAVVAMVRAVVPAGIVHRPAERDDFVVVGVHARRVRQSGRQAHGALGHTLRDDRDHALELIGCRRTLLSSKYLHPHVAVRHEIRNVHRCSEIDSGQILRRPFASLVPHRVRRSSPLFATRFVAGSDQ